MSFFHLRAVFLTCLCFLNFVSVENASSDEFREAFLRMLGVRPLFEGRINVGQKVYAEIFPHSADLAEGAGANLDPNYFLEWLSEMGYSINLEADLLSVVPDSSVLSGDNPMERVIPGISVEGTIGDIFQQLILDEKLPITLVGRSSSEIYDANIDVVFEGGTLRNFLAVISEEADLSGVLVFLSPVRHSFEGIPPGFIAQIALYGIQK